MTESFFSGSFTISDISKRRAGFARRGGLSKALGIEVEYWDEPAPPDARTLRRRMEREGYSVFEWADRPGAYYPPHSHPEDQSHWVVSGALTLIVGGEEYTLKAGDRDFLPAWTEHEARVEGGEAAVYLIGSKD